MRKLILQTQVSVDGFMGGLNGEMDWVNLEWSDELIAHTQGLSDRVDTILLGHELARGSYRFGCRWRGLRKSRAGSRPLFYGLQKVGFSRSKQVLPASWPNAEFVHDPFETVIAQLKAAQGKDLIAYGGSRWVQSIIAAQLVDEYHLYVNPVALGKGLPLFSALEQAQKLQLTKSLHTASGIQLLFTSHNNATRRVSGNRRSKSASHHCLTGHHGHDP